MNNGSTRLIEEEMSAREATSVGGVTDEKPELSPARDVHVRIAHGVFQIVVGIVLLTNFEVGSFWWWWGAVGLPISAAFLVYWLVDLFRHRHERAEERAERWDPWG